MSEKFLKQVVEIIVGKQAEGIVPLIDSKKHVNEFIIAKKLDITINQTRNILYKLSDFGLVSSIRKKDKKKGWYTYFWKIEKLKTLNFLKETLEKKINQIKNQINNRETKQFYVCNTCRVEFNEENALLYNFTCNECGNTFELKDNVKLLNELKRNLIKLEKELELIDGEINIENEKIKKEMEKVEKAAQKELDKIKAEKKKISQKKSAERRLEKKSIATKKIVVKKTANKSIKKIISKKSVKKIVKNLIAKKKSSKKK
jgi:transcription factor E